MSRFDSNEESVEEISAAADKEVVELLEVDKTAFDSGSCGEDWSHHSGIELILQNITMTVNMGTRLDLQAIVLASRNCEYNPKRFAACIMRLRNPKCTALIFASGKMIITGCKSYEAAIIGARSFVRIMNKVGFRRAEVISPTPQNMVVTCDMGFPIRLEGLVCDHAQFATYEPELFPGLIYRLEHPKLVLIIFVSGKVVMTGGKALVSMQRAFEIMYPVLYEYRKVSALADLARELKVKKAMKAKQAETSANRATTSNGVNNVNSVQQSATTHPPRPKLIAKKSRTNDIRAAKTRENQDSISNVRRGRPLKRKDNDDLSSVGSIETSSKQSISDPCAPRRKRGRPSKSSAKA